MTPAIRLGVMSPFTGIVGMYGVEISRAAQLACQEINEAGGVLGRPLELLIEDDGSLPESGVSAAGRLVAAGCVALVGNLLSNARIAVAYRVAEPMRIPLLNFSFYEGSILSRYFFNFAALPNQQIDRMIPFMAERFGPRMFFAGNAYEWPRGSIAAAKRALERSAGEVVGEQYFALGSAAGDLEALLDRVEATHPDVFVPYFAGSDQIALLRRFHARGLASRIAVVMGHYDEVMTSTLAPEVRAGLYSSNTYFMSVDTLENHRLLDRLAAFPGVTGIWPHGNGILTNFGEGAYVCVKAFAAAAERAASVESEALLDALSTVSVQAPQGRVCMTPEIQHAQVSSYLSRCERDGTFSIVESFGAIEPTLPDRYRHQRVGPRTTLEDEVRMQARILSRLSEAVVLVSARDGTVVYNNAAAEQLFGCDEGELVGHSLVHLGETGIAPNLGSTEMAHALTQAGTWQGDIAATRTDGEPLWCAVRASAFTHPFHGEVWLAAVRDVGEQRRAENALRESEARYRRAEQGTNDGLWEWDIATGTNYFSPRWCAILGYDPNGLRFHVDTFTELVHPDDRADVWGAIQRHDQLGQPYDVEFRMRHKDGEYRWVRSRGQMSCDERNGGKRMTGSISDVSKQKQAEERLLEAHRLAGLGAWEQDLGTGATWWSDHQYLVNGVEPGTPITSDSFLQLIHPDDRLEFAAGYQRVFAEGTLVHDYRIVRPDGQIRHVRGIATLTRDASGRPVRMSGTNQDITASVRAEESIRRSLAEKETLLREIHHRVKNNLAIVGSLVHFQSRKLSSEKDVEALAELRQRIQAMSLVHDRLYQNHDVAHVDFADYVQMLTTDLCRSAAKSSSLRIEVTSDEICLPIEIAMPAGQILCELITNVLKYAFPGGGSGHAAVSVRRVDRDIVLAVDDDGIGLPAGFDPHAGTSFGWLLVRTLVKQLSGAFEVSRGGAGAHVRITFPAFPPG